MMEGAFDTFDFVLAEALGMTVARLRAEMPNIERTQWQAFFTYRNAMRELEADE